ncbi:hypothetical protein LZ554_008035 [Drepanopeziza brunnea f. sp. 'monogermtubi']|nr:hypothetical protein LZ554_008035 [Drepanopeziza brunnea f. sp. 'monogermtubi']
MLKDSIFFTPEVDHSMNIINETNREEHSKDEENIEFCIQLFQYFGDEDVPLRRTDEFVKAVGALQSQNKKRGFNIVRQFNYVTFEIMGEMSFGDFFDARLARKPEHRYHWAGVIVNTTYVNDVMRAVCVLPGIFSLLEWLKPKPVRDAVPACRICYRGH